MSEPAQPETSAPVCYRHPTREAHIRCQRCGRPICPDCMRDASVGFQCPGCVAEGRKETRQGQLAYGGTPTRNPAATSIALIGVNVFVWVLVLATGWRDSPLIDRLALVPRGLCGVLRDSNSYFSNVPSAEVCSTISGTRWLPGVADGAVWQLVSNMFLHTEIWHIAGNMFTFYLLGPQVERVLGRTRFLSVYFLAGLAGSATILWLANPESTTLGASGAIFGVFGALVVLVHKVGGDLRSIGGLVVLNVALTFLVPNVSWQGHLGGFLGGLAATAIVVYAPRGPRRPVLQAAGLGLVLLVVAAAVVVRVIALG